MRPRMIAKSAVWLACFTAACGRERLTEPNVGAAVAAATGTQGQGIIRPQEQPFLDIAARVPGFGGYWYDEYGNLHYYLLPTGDEIAAREALLPVLKAHDASFSPHAVADPQLVRHVGRFDFATLAAWRDAVLRAAAPLDGFIFLDLAEDKNVIVIGVRDRSAADAVLGAAITLGIPTDAITTVLTEPAIASTGVPSGNISSFVRPIVGGLKISYSDPTGFRTRSCSLGFTAVPAFGSGYGPGYVTASHCSNSRGVVESLIHYQDVVSISNRIATEVVDPPWRDASYWGSSCPTGYKCRYSDAAFYQMDPGIDYLLGALARTTYYGGPGTDSIVGPPGSTDIDPAHPTWSIVGKSTGLSLGDAVQKEGWFTGWTWGQIDRTCADINVVDKTQVDPGGQRWLTFCGNHICLAYTHEGDSGGPVFSITGTADQSRAVLQGTIVAKGSGCWFSPLANIELELGTLTVF